MTDPKIPTPFARPRQLTMAFDPTRLRGMSAAERGMVVTILATLLIEAGAPATGGATTNTETLPTAILSRKAVVYVWQSTPAQVEVNLESQRRQYELVEVARSRGFRSVEVIEDDLGRTTSLSLRSP